MPSIFTRIIQGELPSYKIFENEHVFSFLALDQVEPGHTLVVPKLECDHFFEVPEPYYSAVFAAAKPIAKAIREATGYPRVGSAILGFEVAHFHLHLVPLESIGGLNFSRGKRLDDAQMISIQQKIVGQLAKINSGSSR